MSGINRPDTLDTELRELRRRIRLLESASGRATAGPDPGPADPAASPAWGLPGPVLLPTRAIDWWWVDSAWWQRVAVCLLPPGTRRATLLLYAGYGEGAIRIGIDGAPFDDPIPVRAPGLRHTFRVPILPAESAGGGPAGGSPGERSARASDRASTDPSSAGQVPVDPGSTDPAPMGASVEREVSVEARGSLRLVAALATG